MKCAMRHHYCGHKGQHKPQKISFADVETQYQRHGTLRTLRGQPTQQSTVKIFSAANGEVQLD
jgi:hypothetical protein